MELFPKVLIYDKWHERKKEVDKAHQIVVIY